MRQYLVVLALLLAGSGVVWADGITSVVSTTTQAYRTRTVFNDAGSALTHGSIVVWDNDDTEFARSGYPYVTTTTTADEPWVAGVTTDASCADQTLCEIVVEGPVVARIAGATDNVTEDTLVGTSTVAGQVGDYTAAANSCSLGNFIGDGAAGAGGRQAYTGATTSLNVDNTPQWVFVNITCQ